MAARPPKNGSPQDQPEVVYLPDYDRSAFMEELMDKYGSSEIGWTNINLYRKNQKGEWPWLYKFDAPPEIWEVSDLFGGGDYKVYINWKDQDGKTNLRTKKFIIEGPPRMPAAGVQINNGAVQQVPVSPAQAEDPEIAFLNKALLYKKLYGGDEKSGSDSQVILAAMNNTHALMMEAMKTNKPAEDPTTKRLMDKLTDVAFEKSTGSEIDTYLKIDKAINKNSAAPAEDSVTGIIKESLPVLLELFANKGAGAGVVHARRGTNPGPGVNGAGIRPVNNSMQAPGGAQTGLEGINQAIQEMSRIMDNNFRAVSDQVNGLQQNLTNIDTRLKELEDDYWIDDPPAGDHPDVNNNMVVVNQEQRGGEYQVKTKNPIYLAMGKKLRDASDQEKVTHLQTYVPQFGDAATYQWCRDYDAIDTLEEFNRLMKLAGYEDLVLTEEYTPE